MQTLKRHLHTLYLNTEKFVLTGVGRKRLIIRHATDLKNMNSSVALTLFFFSVTFGHTEGVFRVPESLHTKRKGFDVTENSRGIQLGSGNTSLGLR